MSADFPHIREAGRQLALKRERLVFQILTERPMNEIEPIARNPVDREMQLRQCHCDHHKSYDPMCNGCRSKLEERLGAELRMVDMTPPPQPTEEELRTYLDRKRREAGGR